MGRLFDSMKQRTGNLPGASPGIASVATTPRLQVIPSTHSLASALAPVDDHEVMPYYEVPNDQENRSTVRPPDAAEVREQPAIRISTPAAAESDLPNHLPVKLSFAATSVKDPAALHHFADELVVVHQPQSPASNEYRSMAEQLIQELTSLQAQSLTILPLSSVSTSVVAANLSCAWADITRHPLVLIDAARSRPGDDIACLFGLTHAPGWEELMTGSSLGEALQQTGRAWLDLIGTGRRLAWSNTQSWAEKTRSVLHALLKHYRHVVLLGPAFPHSPLGLVLAETTESTCIMMTGDEQQSTHKDTVLQVLSQQGKPVLGTIQLDL